VAGKTTVVDFLPVGCDAASAANAANATRAAMTMKMLMADILLPAGLLPQWPERQQQLIFCQLAGMLLGCCKTWP
jgi:hypothetical protein